MYEDITKQAKTVITELLDQANLKPGALLVVGCSSSEIVGKQIGKGSSMDAAQAAFRGIYPILQERGIQLAVQCCEHLNRALILERTAAEHHGYEIVNVLPQPHAGGSFAVTAWNAFADPVAVEAILLKHPNAHTVQMDSVIGTVGGKVLLTIHFPETSFMMAFLRDANTSQSVIDVFDYLYRKLGKDLFEKIFPVILTDRGSEFSNPKMIECEPSCGIRRTNVFYCDPSSPYQKGSIEVNHELVRRILPKGTSFDKLTQTDIDHMMNHINSYRRAKLGNRTPYEAFTFYYGKEALEKIGYSQIDPSCVVMTPKLFKR